MRFRGFCDKVVDLTVEDTLSALTTKSIPEMSAASHSREYLCKSLNSLKWPL